MIVAAVALSLAACASRSCDVGPVHLADIHDYSGRCGDPPHGTSYRVLVCQVSHDDPPSGGAWRWRCD